MGVGVGVSVGVVMLVGVGLGVRVASQMQQNWLRHGSPAESHSTKANPAQVGVVVGVGVGVGVGAEVNVSGAVGEGIARHAKNVCPPTRSVKQPGNWSHPPRPAS